jgi:hypothetical protein
MDFVSNRAAAELVLSADPSEGADPASACGWPVGWNEDPRILEPPVTALSYDGRISISLAAYY